MSDAALHPDRRARHSGDHGAAATTRAWAVSVLALATLVLLAWVAFLVVVVGMFAATLGGVLGAGSLSVDPWSVVGDVAPALLVGWCTGLAASAGLTGGAALGPRVAGITAGAVGSLAGAAVLALSGTLL